MRYWRSLRRRILSPGRSQTKLRRRRFHRKSADSQKILESVGEAFVTGFEYAAEARLARDAEERLEALPRRYRGFAYEGAAMGFCVRDGLPLGGGTMMARFLAGRANRHLYMAYIGAGWAMARLPRSRRPDATTYDRLLRWLVADGYGFHQAYFHTDTTVRRHTGRVPGPTFAPFPDDRTGYTARAMDQGIGRALWFVGGTDPGVVADLTGRFDRTRGPDLWSGIGLAATYAGGADDAELARLRDLAGPHRRELAQGSAFAAESRIHADLLTEHTELATHVLCGLPAAEAAAITQELRPDEPIDTDVPAYETWRRHIADAVTARGGIQT
ncbi:DUF1702 family protein [Saccharomonospora halophila]|uniref:DUF1702 family protein n=1 Tax=Saccharomonospora halophila TaxID=129922 RepID=UPI0003AA9503|nr:DUF1702 family protein [Saccharomonospora halophila]